MSTSKSDAGGDIQKLLDRSQNLFCGGEDKVGIILQTSLLFEAIAGSAGMCLQMANPQVCFIVMHPNYCHKIVNRKPLSNTSRVKCNAGR